MSSKHVLSSIIIGSVVQALKEMLGGRPLQRVEHQNLVEERPETAVGLAEVTTRLYLGLSRQVTDVGGLLELLDEVVKARLMVAPLQNDDELIADMLSLHEVLEELGIFSEHVVNV